MPFLQQGDSDVVTLTAGQSIAVGAPVDSSANVLIPLGLPGGPSAVVTSTTQTFGPYPNGATITVVAARGQVEYQTGVNPSVPALSVPGLSTANTAAAAAENAAAIQAALDRKGQITIGGTGEYFVDRTLFVSDDTTLFISSGATLKLRAGAGVNLIRNKAFNPVDGSGWKPITSIATTDGITVTVTCPSPHGLSTGDIRLINGAVPDDFNGVYSITVTGPNAFTYVRDLNTGTQFTTPATTRTASITGTSSNGSKIVTSVSSVDNLICGSFVTGTNIPAGARIDTIDSASQITLTLAATGANAGLTCAFPLQHCPANRNIRITGGGALDWNGINQVVGDNLNIYCVVLRGVGNASVDHLRVIDFGGNAVHLEGSYDCVIDNIWMRGASNYQSNGPHFDHCGRDIVISNIFGSTKDDFVSIIQKQYVQYMDAGTPIGDCSRLVIENVYPDGCLSAVKILPVAGLVYDQVTVRNVTGRVTATNVLALPCFDPINTGNHVTGTARSLGTISNIVIDTCSSTANASSVLWVSTAKATNVKMVNCAVSNIGATGKFGSVSPNSTLERVTISNCSIDSSSNPLALQINGSLKRLTLSDITMTSAGGFFMKMETGTPNAMTIKGTNIELNGCATFCGFAGQTGVVVNLTNVEFLNFTSNFFQADSSSQFFAQLVNCNIPNANFTGGTFTNGSAIWSDSRGEFMGSGASLTPNGLRRARKMITVNQNMTIANPINILQFNNLEAYKLTFCLLNDATGNYTITWGSNYLFPVAFVQSGVGSANKKTIVEFAFDGVSSFICTSGLNAWF